MILRESTETRHREVHGRIPKCLPKLVRTSREEVLERAEEVYGAEPVGYLGPQWHARYGTFRNSPIEVQIAEYVRVTNLRRRSRSRSFS